MSDLCCNTRDLQNIFQWSILWLSLWIFSTTALEIDGLANSDRKCLDLYRSKFKCPQTIDRVCAKHNGEYISSINVCNFCRKYGNTNSLILKLGPPGDNQVSCQPLHLGSLAIDDPECQLFYGQLFCTREYWPIRATLAGKVVSGGNKCDFCSKFGNSSARIISIGADEDLQCTTMNVGCRAHEIASCQASAQHLEIACTADYYPICAKLSNGTFIESSNECVFCVQHGSSSAVIISIGSPCSTESNWK